MATRDFNVVVTARSLGNLTDSETVVLTVDEGGFDPDLVLYYPFTADANDAVGSNDLTVSGSVVYGANGIEFDGSSYANKTDFDDSLDRTNAQGFTIGSFGTFNELGVFNFIFSAGPNDDYFRWNIGSDNLLDARNCDLQENNLLGGAASIDTEYHVVLVYDPDDPTEKQRFYVNGTQESAYNNSSIGLDLQELWVGTNMNDTTPPGAASVRDLRLYHRVLSDAEIAQWAAGTLSP